MKYRHEFHAGNFADVHKHVALVAVLRALQRKDKGLLVAESHAGRGLYVGGHDGHLGSEIRDGYARLPTPATVAAGATVAPSPEIADYLAVERDALAAALGASARSPGSSAATTPGSGPRTGVRAPAAYAGSPLLIAGLLRAQDRAVCCELQPSECRALEASLRPWPRAQTRCDDGLAALRALLPPPERRALVLIDPPYEDVAEFDTALAAAREALVRLPNAVILLWYPIKDDRQLAPWLRRCAAALSAAGAPTLQCELWRHPRDSRVALNGSGLLIVNAPWQLDERMQHWLPELGTLLALDTQGGTALHWLVPERRSDS
jgi:23S rRNA (adenine2030-N6)-methyltransferase